ncbi:MAG: hypothetical protein NVSMB39_6430 [Candidatus Saccharimonadales bacterium]
MSDLISHTARLVPYTKRPKHMASFVTAYFYEPSADEIGARLGNFFVVVEVLVSGRASEEVVDLIIQTAGEKYYNYPAGDADPLARFETAVKQTNHELSEYVGRGNAAWIGKLSAILAVQAGAELHVAQTGSAEAFLYRGKAVSRICVPDTTRPASPSKTFGSIATGVLDSGDKLLLATPALVHQIPLKKLQQTITATNPNIAIGEISQLLEGAVTNRIAAIIVEITTPEIAALQVRTEEPAEIELGNNETLAAAALSVAAPLAQTTAQTSARAARVMADTIQAVKPHARRLSLAAADKLRQSLSTRRGQLTVGAVALIAFFLVIFVSLHNFGQASSAKAFAQYQSLFSQYQTTLGSSDKTAVRARLVSIQNDLAKINTHAINAQLANSPLPQSEPNTVAGLKTLIADQIDQLDGLVKAAPTTLTEVGGKSGRPTHFESDGTRAYIFDAANHNAISIVNLLTGNQSDSVADTSKLGDVVSTTLSYNKDGIYILTAKPSVWFYRFTGDTLTEQTVQYDTWPKSTAIASYASNLYLLGPTSIFKHTRNAAGYSPKSEYITQAAYGVEAASLAVDGYIYVVNKTTIQQFLGTVARQTATLPASAAGVSCLRSSAGGDVITGVSSSTGRIAVWSDKSDKLVFDKQVSLSSGKTVYDAVYDAKLGKIFATVDNRLVSLPFTP